jgi:hypothetical protein
MVRATSRLEYVLGTGYVVRISVRVRARVKVKVRVRKG